MGEPNTVTKTAPEHIWLQHSDSDLDVDSPFPESYDGISWRAEQVFQADVEYTRSDLHATLKRQRDALLGIPDLVPTNWVDPLLTGPDGIGSPPYDCMTIGKLLRGIQDRLRAAIAAMKENAE